MIATRTFNSDISSSTGYFGRITPGHALKPQKVNPQRMKEIFDTLAEFPSKFLDENEIYRFCYRIQEHKKCAAMSAKVYFTLDPLYPIRK